MQDDEFDPSDMTALVIDEHAPARAISIEQLRGLGFRRIVVAATPAEAWDSLRIHKPDVVFIEWLANADSLAFIRRVRLSEDAPNRAVNMFMLTMRGAQAEVEAARTAGADGYMRKPISGAALRKHIRRVVADPRPFVETAAYVGPCRRRRAELSFAGPWRRINDVQPAAGEVAGDEDVLDLKAELARARVAALEGAVRELRAGDAEAARTVFKAAQALADVAEQIGDSCLLLGAKELARYMQAQGATERLDPEVVQTHTAALHQLAHLPHALNQERDRVSQSLKRMIDKKLRQAADAA